MVCEKKKLTDNMTSIIKSPTNRRIKSISCILKQLFGTRKCSLEQGRLKSPKQLVSSKYVQSNYFIVPGFLCIYKENQGARNIRFILGGE